MENLIHDVRYGIRMLLRKPSFTAVAVITLALGIGANSAIFSVVNALLLRPLPFENPDRLVFVNMTNLSKDQNNFGVSLPDFREWRDRNTVFEEIAALNVKDFNLSGKDQPERISGATVSADFFKLL